MSIVITRQQREEQESERVKTKESENPHEWQFNWYGTRGCLVQHKQHQNPLSEGKTHIFGTQSVS
jgi:phosphomevalonate kinase